MHSLDKHSTSHIPAIPILSRVLRLADRFNINLTIWCGFLLAIVVSAAFSGCSSEEMEKAEARSEAGLAEPITLKIVTFNVWDFYIFPDRKRRMLEIGKFLAKHDPDLVGLQEAFVEKDRRLLLDQLKRSRLKHSHYYPSGTFGSGLTIVSAFPIKETTFHRYSRNGKWYKPWQADWYAGKGVAHTRVELPEGSGYLDFYNTHAIAGYSKQNDLHTEDRIVQMEELAAFMKNSSKDAFPAILVGDMNCSVGSTEYETLVEQAGLVRLMNVDSDIDHIFGINTSPHRFATIETREYSHFGSEEGEELRMSDHNCYISTILIKPAP